MGNLFYEESGKQIGKFPIFPHWLPPHPFAPLHPIIPLPYYTPSSLYPTTPHHPSAPLHPIIPLHPHFIPSSLCPATSQLQPLQITLFPRPFQHLIYSSFSLQVIAVYFSAHWCPPCRGFTPMLKEFWDDNKNKGLVIIFVSSDRSEDDMLSYFAVRAGTLLLLILQDTN